MFHYWLFQGIHYDDPKVAQQEINELTSLADGLLEFQRHYLSTHGEKAPVFRLLSMIIRFIRENTDVIERALVEQPYIKPSKGDGSIPF